MGPEKTAHAQDTAQRPRYFNTETARAGNKRRWDRDPAGVAELVRRIVARAPALTPEQRELIRAALTAPTRANER